MKTAINAWSVDGQTGFEDMFRQIKAAGFDGIELNVDAPGHSAHSLTMDSGEAELASIKALSEQYDLPVVSISTSLYGGGRLMGSPDAENREQAKKLLAKQLFCAEALSATGILIVPGGIGPEVSIAEAYRISAETLADCKEIIDRYKISVGVENVWNTFFLSPFDMRDFIDRIQNPYVTAYYDVGNVVAFSWSEYWIEVLDRRISHIHVKDFKRNGGFNAGGDFVSLRDGDVRWEKIIPALRKAGFDGYLTAEVDRRDGQDYEDFYREACETIRGFINL